ncbi:MAG TPA: pentapeptide repeat-containing protein, partial [Gaiellales bacterium]|nr:pentapeptide repeat-containing protein [Gaiellales bacterium]
MPPPTTPSEPRLPASLEVLSADDPCLQQPQELAGVELHGPGWAGLDASGLRIDETWIWNCDLSGASLADLELTDAVLDEPNLANAVIRGGSLTRVRVSGGRLTGAQWAETRIHDTLWRNAAADL